MIYPFNKTAKVTIYTYIIYLLYKVTLLFLLIGKYIKLIYCVGYLLKDIGYLNLTTQNLIFFLTCKSNRLLKQTNLLINFQRRKYETKFSY